MKHTHLRDMFKTDFKSVRTSTVTESPDPLSPLYQLLLTMKAPENTDFLKFFLPGNNHTTEEFNNHTHQTIL